MDNILLDLGCGKRKTPGYLGIDITTVAGVDLVCNIDYQLPFKDNSVSGINATFLFEHIKNLIPFFRELHRVCQKGALITFKVPYYQSISQYKDPTHRSFITPETLQYFTEDNWYGADYRIGVKFKKISLEYEYYPPFTGWKRRRYMLLWPILMPALRLARRFLWNVVHSTIIKIEVIK